MHAQRKEIVSSEEELSISYQCELLDIPRTSFYYISEPVSDEELLLMKLIEPCYLQMPYCGTGCIKDWLYDEHGVVVNRKRIQKLSGL
ncbi:MAG: putative transposase [bacterium]